MQNTEIRFLFENSEKKLVRNNVQGFEFGTAKSIGTSSKCYIFEVHFKVSPENFLFISLTGNKIYGSLQFQQKKISTIFKNQTSIIVNVFKSECTESSTMSFEI